MSELRSEIGYSCRSLLKSPGYLITVLLSLALGVGTSALVFAIVDASALRAPPYARPHELAQIMATDGEACDARCPDLLTGTQLRAVREQTHSFNEIAAYRWSDALLQGTSSGTRVARTAVSGEFFSILGVPAMRGRALDEHDAASGAAPTVVLSHALWRQRFGGDDRVIGSTIRLDGTPFSVVGVMPAEFRYSTGTQIWTSLPSSSLERTDDTQGYMAVGRLRPGTTVGRARAELRVIMRQQELHDPVANGGHGATATSLVDLQRAMPRSALQLLVGAVGAMLLIVLANLQALAVVRTLRRSGAMAVRAALGASRWRLARQLLVESLLLSSVGGAFGLLLAASSTNVASAFMQRWFNLPLLLRLDAPVLGIACAVAIASGGVIALAPIVQIISLDIRNALSDGGVNTSGSRRQRHLRQVAVGIQIALTLVLLAAAGTLTRSFLYLQNANVGYDADHLLVATLDFHGTRYADPDHARELSGRLLDRFSSLAGDGSVAVWRTLAPSMMVRPGEDYATIEGRPEGFSRECRGIAACRIPTSTQDVSPGFFNTTGIRIVRGRAFTTADGPGAPPVTIVTETAAQRWWPGEDPIGKRFKIGGLTSPFPWMTVIGITADAQDVNEWGLTGAGVRNELKHHYPGFFRPIAQTDLISRGRPVWTSSLLLGIHTSGDPHSLVANVRSELDTLAPDLPIGVVRSLRDIMLEGGTNGRLQLNARIMVGVSAVALLLAIVGLYGVVADAVRSRTKEIAIRMALGAHSAHVISSVTRAGIATGCAGILGGCAVSGVLRDALARAFFGATAHFKQGYLVGSHPGDPIVTIGAAFALLCVVVAASCLTARRATQVDPAVVLRSE
jgi:putative ABC transport system permease protein